MIIGSEKYRLDKAVNKELYKMSNIWRYSGRLVLKPENLAEHSYYVTMKVIELGQFYKFSEEDIFKAIKIALCHDLGEIYTGDIPHSLKTYSPEIKRVSEKLEVELIKENFPYFGEVFEEFEAKADLKISYLVELADIADVIMFIDREESLGNKDPDIIQIRAECSERYVRTSTLLEQLLSAR